MFNQYLEVVREWHKPQPDKPEETPDAVLRVLWFRAAGIPTTIAGAHRRALPDLDDAGAGRLGELLVRKRDGVPLAHLTGRQEFLGLELLADQSALIPRKETEILGNAARAELHRRALRSDSVLLIDVCTGSGNLALALAHSEPKATVFAADISEAAVALARRNAQFTGLSDRVHFESGDLFGPFSAYPQLVGNCDMVVCNPPYISSAKVPTMASEISAHEPKLAFDGGPLGISILTRLIENAPTFLRPGGVLCFEVGLGQGAAIESRIRRQPWIANVDCHHDDAGAIRAISVERKAA